MRPERELAVAVETNTVTIPQAEYLRDPATAFREVDNGLRVAVLDADGCERMVIYPGTIADIPDEL